MRNGASVHFNSGGISRSRPWPSATGRHFESLLPGLALASRTWLFASRILASIIPSCLFACLYFSEIVILPSTGPHFFRV